MGDRRRNLFVEILLTTSVTRDGTSIVCEGMTPAIEIEGLRKVYRRRGQEVCAVDGLDLYVPEGGVFGFLGPNGSGKTTTIRCLLGLVRATSGRMALLGQPTPSGLGSVMRNIGAIVETPAMFPTMTGRETCGCSARSTGSASDASWNASNSSG